MAKKTKTRRAVKRTRRLTKVTANFVHFEFTPRFRYDKRSVRSIKHKSGYVIRIACPLGKWGTRKRCKVGTKAISILMPRKIARAMLRLPKSRKLKSLYVLPRRKIAANPWRGHNPAQKLPRAGETVKVSGPGGSSATLKRTSSGQGWIMFLTPGGRTRFGDAQQIREDIAHFQLTGALPQSKKLWYNPRRRGAKNPRWMSEQQEKRLQHLVDKVDRLGAVSELTPSEKREFEKLAELYDMATGTRGDHPPGANPRRRR